MTEKPTPPSDDLQAAQLAAARDEVRASGVLPARSSALPEEEPGTLIGRYKLLQQIGEGGFGTVWMAEQQEPVKRRVALKILKLGMDTRRVVARFEAERQALALMDHPGIAKVLDGGATESGRPYFVMELVQGVSITEYCDAAGLSTRERLELFAQVCRAVQHAHLKGIVHRDIKPSNVLVTLHDGVPVPKVIDFGIAKAMNQELTTKTLFTEFRQLIGTPQYMSPEQSEMSGLDIDTRSDVYSLGVLLYELLTGSPPIDAQRLAEAGLGEVQRLIREEEPEKPSTRLSTMGRELEVVAGRRGCDSASLRRTVAGDLDWIVMRALEKDRRRRYETADALAGDLARHLAHEPVEAGPPSATYRLRKFVRRNRTALGVAAVFLLLLVSGATLALMGYVTAQRAQEMEAVARRAEVQARQLAVAEAESAQDVNAFLIGMLTSTDPLQRLYSPHSLDGVGFEGAGVARTDSVVEMLRLAGERLEEAFVGRPLREAELREALAITMGGHSRYGEAVPHLERAVALREEALGASDPATLRAQLVLAAYVRGERGIELARETLDGYRAAFGPEDPRTLTAKRGLARLLWMNAQPEEGGRLFEETLEAQMRVLGPEHADTLVTKHLWAWVCEMIGMEEGEALAEEVNAVISRDLAEDHPFAISARAQLARWRLEAGRVEEAEELIWSTVEPSLRVLGSEHWLTGTIFLTAAEAARTPGHLARRAELLESTLRSRVSSAYRLEARRRLGRLLVADGYVEEALEHLRLAADEEGEGAGLDDHERLRARVELGCALVVAGDEAAAAEAFAGVQEAVGVTTEPERLVQLQRWRLLPEDSAAAAEEILPWAEARLARSPDSAEAAELLGLALYRAGRSPEAQEALKGLAELPEESPAACALRVLALDPESDALLEQAEELLWDHRFAEDLEQQAWFARAKRAPGDELEVRDRR